MKRPAPPPRHIAVAEVANRLGCSRQHVYNLIAAGHLPATNIARGPRSTIRVNEDDLAAYIAGRTRRAS